MGILFNDLVFGPLKSRRLGISLGVNLMPKAGKICSFNCIYCECGWNDDEKAARLIKPKKEAIEEALERKKAYPYGALNRRRGGLSFDIV